MQVLHQQNHCNGHERVRQSLLRQGLTPVYRRRYRVTTESGHAFPIAAHVLERRFDGWETDRAWVADLTYIATQGGWLYLAAILNLSRRRIAGSPLSTLQ